MNIKTTFNDTHGNKSLFFFNGKEVEIIDVIANPKDNRSSPDAMPILEVSVVKTGEVFGAFPEEIDEKDWPKTLRATLDGLKAFKDGSKNRYDGKEAEYFEYGLELGKYKEDL